ncbi:EamA family transporter [Desulfosporosinus sp. PR]|uniref:DMT family transporter n=1 Tax=Candidatus Desulfosporosinus nitrosoreducens TaxID=3401928 RepID=UPI0027F9E5B3|nr:EamA family transporter [Desulfosporosinus sp. PR]MDQ7096856.1 EamA family transporter [Desulfosporosinus sp. PR]
MNTGLVLIVLSAILWGTAGVSAKYLINMYSLSALTIGAMRLLIASPILLTISKIQLKEKIKIDRKHYALFVIYGITVATYQIAYFMAVKRIMVSVATLIALCTAPIFVAILSRIFLKEKMRTSVIIALVISIVGTSLIIGLTDNQILPGTSYWGYILALGAGLSYAIYTLCGKELIVYYPSTKVISITFSLGAVLMLPFAQIPGNLSWNAWAMLLYLGTVPTAFAYIIFTQGLKKSSATKASIATLFEPLTSTALSILLIGDKFKESQLLGALLLSLALFLLVLGDYFELMGSRLKILVRKINVKSTSHHSD